MINKDFLFSFFVGTVMVVLMGCVAFVPIYKSTKYDKVIGNIIGDELRYTGKQSKRSKTLYVVFFEYEYNNVIYSKEAQVPRPSKRRKKPIGSELEVYVNPYNPEQCVILYGQTLKIGGFLLCLVVLIMFIIHRDELSEEY